MRLQCRRGAPSEYPEIYWVTFEKEWKVSERCWTQAHSLRAVYIVVLTSITGLQRAIDAICGNRILGPLCDID